MERRGTMAGRWDSDLVLFAASRPTGNKLVSGGGVGVGGGYVAEPDPFIRQQH